MTMKRSRGKPESIPAGRFKAECLALLDRVARRREPVVVTKHGRPVAKVVPIEPEPAPSLRGSLTFRGDILSTGEAWDADGA